MSEETLPQIDMNTATPVVETPAFDVDAELGKLWDRDNVNNGSDRANDGKFTSPNAPPEGEALASEGGEEGEGQEPDVSTLADSVPLPSNWRNKADVWEKVPAEAKAWIAEHEAEMDRTLSRNGRVASEYKPVADVIQSYAHLYEGKAQPHEAVQALFNAQQALENPQTRLNALLALADGYGARQELAQALGQQAQQGGDTGRLLSEIAALKQTIQQISNPSGIDQRIEQKLALRDTERELDGLVKDKPLFTSIPEDTMVTFINMAWNRLGQDAAKSAVFNLAYDMAVNADPELRAKAAAPKVAPSPDPKRIADAKRANGVNVTSTSSGKERRLTEDELLSRSYDKAQQG